MNSLWDRIDWIRNERTQPKIGAPALMRFPLKCMQSRCTFMSYRETNVSFFTNRIRIQFQKRCLRAIISRLSWGPHSLSRHFISYDGVHFCLWNGTEIASKVGLFSLSLPIIYQITRQIWLKYEKRQSDCVSRLAVWWIFTARSEKVTCNFLW